MIKKNIPERCEYLISLKENCDNTLNGLLDSSISKLIDDNLFDSLITFSDKLEGAINSLMWVQKDE